MTNGKQNIKGGSKRLTSLPNNIKLAPKFTSSEGISNPTPTITDKPEKNTDLEDQKTNEAIKDIVVSESNAVLRAEDAKDKSNELLKPRNNKGFSFKKLIKNKWTYIILPVLVIAAVFGVPYTRYKLLGLVLSNNYQFSIIDSSTSSLVGGALVTIDGHSLTTNASGSATIKLKLGKYKYSISKQLYKTANGTIFVGIIKSKPQSIKLMATGRQISIKLTDKLSGKPVAGAAISILNTSSSTNSSGLTSLVLPTKSEAYLATISANGYNNQTTSIMLTKKLNSFNLVPSGSLYFLENNAGNLNVEKTNLDGSDPQAYIPGTGHESASTTSLIPSPDWKYLLLEANRSGSQPELYVINTSTGNITEFDSSPDQFTLLGWDGDNFIYDEINQSQANSTTGREEIKSYSATNSRLSILDQNQVDNGASGYAYQAFSNINLLTNEIIYITNWATSGTYDTSTLTTTIRGVQIDGTNENDFQSFATPNTGSISVVKNLPSSIYFSIPNTSTNQTAYYQYTNGAVNANTSLTTANFSQSYPKYYLSPSGTQSLWTQNNTFIGDQDGQNQKQFSPAIGYSAYAWYDNVYILLTKASQLYIDPISGSYPPTLVANFTPSAS